MPNRSRARLALNLVHSFELKLANEAANELAEHLEPYAPPLVLAPVIAPLSVEPIHVLQLPHRVSSDAEIQALGLPWGASAASALPTPPPADGGHFPDDRPPAPLPMSCLSEPPLDHGHECQVPLMVMPRRSDTSGVVVAPGMLRREQHFQQLAIDETDVEGQDVLGGEDRQLASVNGACAWIPVDDAAEPLLVHATSTKWADDEPSESSMSQLPQLADVSSPDFPSTSAAVISEDGSRKSRRSGGAHPQRGWPTVSSLGCDASSSAMVGEEPILPRPAALEDFSDELLRSFGEACGDHDDLALRTLARGHAARSELGEPVPPAIMRSNRPCAPVRATPPKLSSRPMPPINSTLLAVR